jgi:hypothetical protein
MSCVVSKEFTAEQLDGVLSELKQRYKKTKRFKAFSDGDSPVEIAADLLPVLEGVVDANRLSVRIPMVSAASQEALVNVGLAAAKHGAIRVIIAWQICSRQFNANGVHSFDLRVTAGRGRQGNFCGLYAAFENSPGYADIIARRDLFQRAIEALGFAGTVDASIKDGILTMTCAQPWSLNFPVAAPGGKNPFAFNIGGLSSMEDAVFRAVELSRRLGDRVEGVTGAIQCELKAYEQMRPALADAWRGWIVETDGLLTSTAIEILRGTQGWSSERGVLLPAFTWQEANEESIAYGSAIRGNDRFRLQISAPGVTSSALLQAVAFLPDARFSAAP